MKRHIITFIFITLLFPLVSKSQETNLVNNISLELGLGYNTINWEAESLNKNTKYNRNQPNILPSFKLKYSIPIYKINDNSTFAITPFTGYNMFGGKSEKEPNGYKDMFYLQALEIGILPTYSLSGNYMFYGGFKGQYIFSAKSKAYGSINDPIETERKWKTSDCKGLFKNRSFSVGAGFNYMIKRLSIGIETWFGITNLSELESVYENNYRLLLAYRIK